MSPPPVFIRTLGCLEVFVEGVPLEFAGRGPRKPLELLTALVAAGKRGASVGTIADMLWPDADGFDAYRALVTTAHRLRGLLRCRLSVHFGAGRVRLNWHVCEVDVWQFEQRLEEAQTLSQLDALVSLYDGLFQGDDPSVWAMGMRSNLKESVARAERRVALRPRDPVRSREPVRALEHPGSAPQAVRYQAPREQIHTAFGYGDHRDVGPSPRCSVADWRMDRGPE
jgi:DNA-binding SARP family transcriptional activator